MKHTEPAKNGLCRLCCAACKDKYYLGQQAVHKYCYFFRKTASDPSPNYPLRTPKDVLKRMQNKKE